MGFETLACGLVQPPVGPKALVLSTSPMPAMVFRKIPIPSGRSVHRIRERAWVGVPQAIGGRSTHLYLRRQLRDVGPVSSGGEVEPQIHRRTAAPKPPAVSSPEACPTPAARAKAPDRVRQGSDNPSQEATKTASPRQVRPLGSSRRNRRESRHRRWNFCCQGQSRRAGDMVGTSLLSHKKTLRSRR